MATRMQQRRGTQTQWASVDPILSAAEIGFESDTNRFKIGDGVNHWSDLEYFTTDSATAVTQQIQDAINNLIGGAPGVLDTLNELAAAIGDDENFVTTVTTGLSTKAPIDSPTFTGTVSGITKSMVGLLNVDNTSDANKPVSIATQTALDLKADASAITELSQDAVNSAIIAGTGIDKSYDDLNNTITLDIDSTVATKTYADDAVSTHQSDTTNVHGIADTSVLATATTVATAKSEAITAAGLAADTKVSDAVAALTKSSVGLGNVDNTSDANKPVSIATQSALQAVGTALSDHESDTTNVHGIADTSLLATKTYADNAASTAVAAVIDAAPAALNTLNELASALGDDANYATTITNALALKAPLESPTFTGTVVLPTGTVTSEMILNGTIVNADINASAAIDLSKLATDPLARANHTGTQLSSTVSDFVEAAQDAVGNSVGTGLTYTDSTGEIKVTPNTYDAYGSASTALQDAKDYADALTTSDISEGTELYFTDERAQDAVGNALGTGLSYNDATGAVSVTTNTYDAYGSASAVAGSLSTHESDTATHGTTGDIVGTSDTQTLTNKTLTSPKINEDVALTATATELNYVDGVTSAIQDQLDDKAPLASPTFTGTATTNNLVVDGDFTINGTNFAASATSITIEDNLVQIAHNNPANTVDLGIVVGYNDGTAKHAGLVKDTSANTWKLFKGVTTEPATTVDFTEGSLDDLALNALTATSITVGDVSNTEFGYLNGVTSGIQTQLDSKLESSTASSTYAPIASPTFTGTVSGITKSMVGLGSVDDTSDANKPVSTAQQTALDLKANLAAPTFTGTVVLPSTTSIGNVSATEIGYVDGVTSSIQTQLNAKAPLSSPALTGIPTAPTASTGTDTTQVATTEFVNSAIANLVNLNLVLDGGGV
jgi:hypothetical protein